MRISDKTEVELPETLKVASLSSTVSASPTAQAAAGSWSRGCHQPRTWVLVAMTSVLGVAD